MNSGGKMQSYVFGLKICVILLFSVRGAVAQEFVAANPNFGSLQWGRQTINVTIANQVDDYRFVIALSQVEFENMPGSSDRRGRLVTIVDPLQTMTMAIPVEIPENYGTALVTVTLYNVVDTLDNLLPSQKFASFEHRQSFQIPSTLPADLSNITSPPYAHRWGDFDNDFIRALIVMAKRGMTPQEMAARTGAESTAIKSQLERLANRGYLKAVDSIYAPLNAVIDTNDLARLLPEVDRTVETLFRLFQTKLPEYDRYLARLAAEKKVARDGTSVLDVTSVIYHKYPFISAILLWSKIGVEFINDGKPFNIFANEGMERGKYLRSDPCRARMGKYNYLVVGPEDNAGKTFYYYLSDDGAGGDMFYFGANEVAIDCHAFLDSISSAPRSFDWTSFAARQPTYFQYADSTIKLVLPFFGEELTRAAQTLRASIEESYKSPTSPLAIYGVRYWAWNLVVSRLIERLEQAKLFEKEGDGFYHFQRVVLQ